MPKMVVVVAGTVVGGAVVAVTRVTGLTGAGTGAGVGAVEGCVVGAEALVVGAVEPRGVVVAGAVGVVDPGDAAVGGVVAGAVVRMVTRPG